MPAGNPTVSEAASEFTVQVNPAKRDTAVILRANSRSSLITRSDRHQAGTATWQTWALLRAL